MKKHIHNIIIIIILTAFLPQLNASDDLIDSIRKKIDEAKTKDQVALLNDLSRAYWSVSLEESLRYAREALELATTLNDKTGIADALNRIGNTAYLQTNYHEAIDNYHKSLEIRMENNDYEGILGSYNNLYLVNDILGNKERAAESIKKAVELSIEMGDESEIAYYSNIQGSILTELHDFEGAKMNLERALKLYTGSGEVSGAADVYNNLGRMYQRMTLYDEAQECFFEALELFSETGNINGLASVKNNIGIIHKRLDNLDIALDYYYRSLETYKKLGGPRRGIASVLNNIGIVYYEKEDFEATLDYYNRALESYEYFKDIQGIATSSHNLGMLNTRLGNYSEAMKYYNRSLDINLTVGNSYNIANNYNNLGELYLLRGNYDKALKFLEEGLDIAKTLNAKELISENYLFSSKLFNETRQFEKALLFYELYDVYRDSIYTADGGNKIAEIQVRRTREKQLSELELLQKDNDIQLLRLRKQRIYIMFLGGLSFFTGLFIFIVFRMYRYRKRLNMELNEKNEQLELAHNELVVNESSLQKLNQAKDKFFSIIAHDLKNPFNALLGFSETLHQNYKDLSRDQINTYIGIINKSSRNLYQLLENLLEWSKSQTGNINYNPDKLNIDELAESEISTIKPNADRKNITIEKYIDKKLTAFADKNIIATVIRNLMSNAVKFTYINGKIAISAKQKNGFIQIAVTDNGIGIGDIDKKKIFDLDHNLTTVGTDDEKGTGLGLLLCKDFVENSGGSIWVESIIGQGSTFKFTIPASRDKAQKN